MNQKPNRLRGSRDHRPDGLSEDELARQLEREHLEIMEESRRRPTGDTHGGSSQVTRVKELMDARDVLRFIEQVKHDRLTDSGALYRETAKPLETIDEAAPDRADEADEFQLPLESFARFQIVEQVGKGGYGLVYRAVDPLLDREVAIKVPRPELLVTSEMENRFIREAKAAGALSHPNIVTIFESGKQQGICYIASEFVDGDTLSAWCDKEHHKPMDGRMAARLIATLADAIQHAHAHGVTHRDLKPSNIMVQNADPTKLEFSGTDDFASRLRITDFGLAKFDEDTSQVTQSGSLVGTPAYMSPEQTLGEKNSGRSSDIFALGVMLYELITATRPFDGATVFDVIKSVQESEPSAPRKWNGDIHRDLEAICLKCLEKQPARRYPTAYHLQTDLTRFLTDQPVSARPVTYADRLKRWSRRNPALAASMGGMIALAIVWIVSSTVLWLSAAAARNAAQQQKTIADDKASEALIQASLARNSVDQLLLAISQEPSVRSDDMQEFRNKLLANATEYYQLISINRPDDQDVLLEYLKSMHGLAKIHRSLGDLETAARIFTDAITVAQQELPDHHRIRANIQSSFAQCLIAMGRFDDAEAVTRQVVTDLEGVLTDSAEDVTALINALTYAAHSTANQGMASQADQLIDRAIDLTVLVTGEPPESWPATTAWARVLRCKTETAIHFPDHETIARYAPLTRNMFQTLKEQDPDNERMADMCDDAMSSMYKMQGLSHASSGNEAEALEEYLQERSLLEELYHRHPQMPGLAYKLSNNLFRVARTEKQLGQLELAQSRMVEYLPELLDLQDRYPQMMPLWKNSEMLCRQLLAKTYSMDQVDRKLEELHKALDIATELNNDPQNTLENKAILGNLYVELAAIHLENEQSADALDLLEEAIAKLEGIVQSQPTQEFVGFLRQANYLRVRAMLDASESAEFNEAYDRFQQTFADSDETTNLLPWKLVALVRDENYEIARELLSRLDLSSVADPPDLLDVAVGLSRVIETLSDKQPASGDKQAAAELTQQAAMAGVETLERLVDAAEDDAYSMEAVDNDPKLEFVRQTTAYQQWLQDRR